MFTTRGKRRRTKASYALFSLKAEETHLRKSANQMRATSSCLLQSRIEEIHEISKFCDKTLRFRYVSLNTSDLRILGLL